MSAYSSLVLADGATVYYRLAEASGTTLTDSGPNGKNGTIAASGITYSVAGALANDANTALTFAGTSNAAVITEADSGGPLDLADGPFSIELWAKRVGGGGGANHGLIGKGASYAVRFNGVDDTLSLTKSGAGIAKTSNAVTDTGWHYYVITKNAGTTLVYFDGADVTVAQTAATLADTNQNLRFGHTALNSEQFPGSMDEIALYKAVLTPAQVLQHYRTGTGTIALADTVTLSDSQTKDAGVSLSDSVSVLDSLAKDAAVALTDSVTLTDAQAREIGVALADSLTLSDSRTADVAVALADSVTLSDSETADVGLALSDSLTLSEDFSPALSPAAVQAPAVGAWRRLPSRTHLMAFEDSVSVSDAFAYDLRMDPAHEEEQLLWLISA